MAFLKYIVLACLAMFAVEVLADYPKSDRDFALLPPYCKAKLKPSSPEQSRLWAQRLGHDFSHTHHYCAALHSLRLARSIISLDRNQQQGKKGLLANVTGEIGYMEAHANPAYILFPAIYSTKAEAYFISGNTDEAVKYLYKAIKSNRKYTKPYKILADFYLDLGRRQDAREVLEKGLKYSPKSKSLQRRMKKLAAQ